MRIRRHALVAAALCLALAGCGSSANDPQPVAGSPAASGEALPAGTDEPVGLSATQLPAPSPTAGPRAPTKTFAIGTRSLSLSRSGRSLPTTVWYPATSKGSNTPVAAGVFPVLVFSHGLNGLPEYYQQLTTRFAAAGFVVAAPAYPFTKKGASPFNAGDMGNQPADASYVVTKVLELNTRSGDRFAGHLDGSHVGAAGHSAGGFTTAGMLASGKRDTRIKAGIVIAGGPMGTFSGPRTPVLFVHGDKDGTVSWATGHNAYAKLSWPKAFLTEIGQGHGEYLGPGAKGFDQMMRTMLDFLRWALYGDTTAKGRLAKGAVTSGVTRYESKL
ncbi:putative dienelactone hydrolase [Allocatelliglobosispora scoriae]|uniref:Putative dienelactone hydrolase n=1 Tax=Allocatelliglobosispora scoriae TaxID=643052 RepID=A0A841BWN2_9ACTN|nr:alpha/beta hydrolase [Allocatelliglobosispora scoriae]MBB5872564.1 putative dienelactone hydrolase [Allocatelliglobosispora scoriae]